ncbi:MAG: adenosylcobinamide-GDP ribazoletransferase [Bacillota bacterium]|nr:adenosylcobinamide-GDP ribazoletransferase [Bacillota bacterium]
MKSYLRALAFLTIAPLPFIRFEEGGEDLTSAAVAFPLAGATLGLVLAVAAYVIMLIFPPYPTAVVVMALSLFLTRGLHFDGLADTADGLLGTTDRKKAFIAMKDSAIGVMGTAVLLFVYLLKLALLAGLLPGAVPAAVFLMIVAGRWAIVCSGSWFPPARDQGLGGLFLRGLKPVIFLKASLAAILLLVLIFLLWPDLLLPGVIGILFALVAAYLLALYASHRLGGLTGDILGAASELGELFFLIGYFVILQFGDAAEPFYRAVILLAEGI